MAGNAKVGNRVNMITRWQALEYIVAQNLERRALAALETLTVVPGAVGAWRKTALLEVGGYPTDTLAEDQDLTIHLQSKGYRVRFDSTAVAWTEAPNTFAGLARQRFRWAYGTLQCLWKYRRITFNTRYGALGLIALPQVWLFQIVLTALAPLADLLLVWQLIGQGIAYLQHGSEFTNDNLVIVGIYYAVFIGRRSDRRDDRLSHGKERGLEPVVVAHSAAFRLPPADVLRGGAFHLDRHQGPVRRLGQTRTHRHGQGGADVGVKIRRSITNTTQRRMTGCF